MCGFDFLCFGAERFKGSGYTPDWRQTQQNPSCSSQLAAGLEDSLEGQASSQSQRQDKAEAAVVAATLLSSLVLLGGGSGGSRAFKDLEGQASFLGRRFQRNSYDQGPCSHLLVAQGCAVGVEAILHDSLGSSGLESLQYQPYT